VIVVPAVIRVPATGPDWATIMTAIGTVAVAVVAVAVALFAEWRADKRVAAERAHSAAQLREEREHSTAQLAEERRIAAEREQYAEAYMVRVLPGERDAGPPTDGIYEQADASLKRLGAIVINGGAYTITGIEARLRLANGTVVPFGGSERVTGTGGLDGRLTDGMTGLLEALTYSDRLAPWDVGLRFYSDPRPIAAWYPIVRWTDRWGTRWEHRRGEVRPVKEGQPWAPDQSKGT
jgi:hypothetical protein